MCRNMSFNEWLYKIHKMTKEMYDKRSAMIRLAIDEEYAKYEEEQRWLCEHDLEYQLNSFEKKLLHKKEELEKLKFSQYYKRKENLMMQYK